MKILFSYVFKIYKFLFCYKDLAEKSKIVEEKNDKVVDFLINHEIHRLKFKLFKRSFHLSIHTNFPKTGIINNSFNKFDEKSKMSSSFLDKLKLDDKRKIKTLDMKKVQELRKLGSMDANKFLHPIKDSTPGIVKVLKNPINDSNSNSKLMPNFMSKLPTFDIKKPVEDAISKKLDETKNSIINTAKTTGGYGC